MNITDKELLHFTLECASKYGSSKARATLTRSSEQLIATLNAQVDRVTCCQDNSLSITLFVDGKFGSFSTNRIDRESLDGFIRNAADTVRMLAPDSCRDLPDPSLCAKDAILGDELELVDPDYWSMSSDTRKKIALEAAVYGKDQRIISEEGEYSDSIYEVLLMDSNGVCCMHRETSYDYGVEITVEAGGEKYSGYWWHSSSRLSSLDYRTCGKEALNRALAMEGARSTRSGKYNMVVDSDVASKMVSPIISALNAYSIQQSNSFLMDSLGKKVFPEGFTMLDLPHIKGQCCSKLFDSEGVATRQLPIIEKGVVKQYFVNTYMSRKLGIPQTIEDPTRPYVAGWPKEGLTRDDILGMCSEGILVTDFNGGNCNSATGDFSYGVEGFLFKNGKIERPVSEMLVTGNFLGLWGNLIAAGSDSRDCMSKLIPTLAFSNVDFNG